MNKMSFGAGTVPGPLPSRQPVVLGAIGVALQEVLLRIATSSWHRDALTDLPGGSEHLRRDIGL